MKQGKITSNKNFRGLYTQVLIKDVVLKDIIDLGKNRVSD